MKALHLAAGNLFGGVETYLLALARLRDFCPKMDPEFGTCFPGRLRDELAAIGVPVHDLGEIRVSRPWSVSAGRRRLKKLVRDRHIDTVVTHGSWAHVVFAPAVRAAGARLVNFVHDLLLSGHWLNRWAARTQPDAVVANSRFTAGTIGKVFPNRAAEVVYFPMERNTTVFDRRSIRLSLDTSGNAVVILLASRLERMKGHCVLLRALGSLKDVPNWVAWMAGGPQKGGEAAYQQELESYAEAEAIVTRIRFLGQRTDIPALMTAADIYCQPNTGPETFGITFVEALANGLPVVSSAIGGAAEIVNNDCGILCPPGDANALADALRDLIVNPRHRLSLSEAGPVRAASLCDPADQLSKLASVITNDEMRRIHGESVVPNWP